MSTYWGYVCRSHDPELESEHWINHGEEVLADIANRALGPQGWPEQPVLGGPIPFYFDGVHWTAPIVWLQQHPRCDIALRNEYGKTEEIAAWLKQPEHNQG
jgi:hypothetical protein